MNQTINLVESLLIRGRALIGQGRPSEARTTLEQLLDLPGVDPSDRRDAHSLLADIHLDQHHCTKARRHLSAALALEPENPSILFRYAQAVDLDPDSDPRKAWKPLRKAIELSPNEPAYWSLLGQVALRLKKRGTALKAFRRAASLAPTALEVLDEIADGMTFLNRIEEAGAFLATARFRLPRDSGLERIWNRFRFDCLKRKQEAAHTAIEPDADTVLLPFVAEPAGTRQVVGASVLREDRSSKAAPHLHKLCIFRTS